MKAISLGGITFDNPLFIREEFNLKNVKGKAFNTLNGGLVVYETPKRNNADYYTLISKESGWISKETLQSIISILNGLNVETDLVFDNTLNIKVRPAFEKGEVIVAESLVNENSGFYNVTINLCRV